jgi:hypothetical protein
MKRRDFLTLAGFSGPPEVWIRLMNRFAGFGAVQRAIKQSVLTMQHRARFQFSSYARSTACPTHLDCSDGDPWL